MECACIANGCFFILVWFGVLLSSFFYFFSSLFWALRRQGSIDHGSSVCLSISVHPDSPVTTAKDQEEGAGVLSLETRRLLVLYGGIHFSSSSFFLLTHKFGLSITCTYLSLSFSSLTLWIGPWGGVYTVGPKPGNGEGGNGGGVRAGR